MPKSPRKLTSTRVDATVPFTNKSPPIEQEEPRELSEVSEDIEHKDMKVHPEEQKDLHEVRKPKRVIFDLPKPSKEIMEAEESSQECVWKRNGGSV